MNRLSLPGVSPWLATMPGAMSSQPRPATRSGRFMCGLGGRALARLPEAFLGVPLRTLPLATGAAALALSAGLPLVVALPPGPGGRAAAEATVTVCCRGCRVASKKANPATMAINRKKTM